MGLDQTLNWIGKPSKDQVSRLHHKYLSDFGSNGLNYISEEDYNSPVYQHIKQYMIPEEVYIYNTDWDLIKKDCGVPLDSKICMISGNKVAFGTAYNQNDVQEFSINTLSERYERHVLSTQYFFLEDEVYRWRKNYDIQNLFNRTYQDVWDEYDGKYEVVYGGYYPITLELLEEMYKIDPVFASKYNNEIENIYYESDW